MLDPQGFTTIQPTPHSSNLPKVRGEPHNRSLIFKKARSCHLEDTHGVGLSCATHRTLASLEHQYLQDLTRLRLCHDVARGMHFLRLFHHTW